VESCDAGRFADEGNHGQASGQNQPILEPHAPPPTDKIALMGRCMQMDKFYRSANGIWLTGQVRVKYLMLAECRP
jgi:hypothetical protein